MAVFCPRPVGKRLRGVRELTKTTGEEASVALAKSLDELNSMMVVQMKLELSWKDSRLQFIKVQKNKLNPLTLKQKKSLWLPHIIFQTTSDKMEANFADGFATGMIKIDQSARGQIASMNEAINFRQYSGSEG